MSQSIKKEHVSRMFPFEFYEELSQVLKGYTLTNPAFILRGQPGYDVTARKKLYSETLGTAAINTMNNNNIINIELFGDVLMLDICCANKYIEWLKDETKRSQMPITVLVAQLYDASSQPLFTRDAKEEIIAELPTLTWNDPNLMLAVVEISEKGTNVGVLKIPERIEEKMFESMDSKE